MRTFKIQLLLAISVLTLMASCDKDEVTVKRFPDAIHAFTIKRLAGHEEACDLVCRFIRGGIKMNP